MVDEGLRQVALAPKLLDRDCAVTLGELLSVRAEDAGEVPVRGQRSSKRLQDADLLRCIRDVVVAAQDLRDAVQPVFDG